MGQEKRASDHEHESNERFEQPQLDGVLGDPVDGIAERCGHLPSLARFRPYISSAEVCSLRQLVYTMTAPTFGIYVQVKAYVLIVYNRSASVLSVPSTASQRSLSALSAPPATLEANGGRT
ncbi:hypothetical protein Ssi02_21920 [Sinosporangium siamense]|uniref:Uncharacterized protein n=1 Tax=Sinosporangium siamense TaxID=1367973 RepID=A0A919RHB3_9ACTN|nr:hypothetical protein Ssi02_21920 [Sinosporangium siamense]